MEMFILGVAFGIWHMIVFAAFFVALVIGCTLDRHGGVAPKWWVLVIGISVLIITFWDSWTFGSALDTFTSQAFWIPAGIYFGAGLLYCIPEFILLVRRSVKKYRADFESLKAGTTDVVKLDTNGEMLPRATDSRGRVLGWDIEQMSNKLIFQAAVRGEMRGTESYVSIAEKLLAGFVGRRFQGQVICLEVKNLDVSPYVDKIELAGYVAAWTIFWPFYLVSMIIGDLLAAAWDFFAAILVKMLGRFVKFSFNDVFKF